MNKKRVLILGGATLLVIGAAAWILPRFLDVDRYRPWLVEQVNHSIRGQFELGHLDLTLWGRLAVKADGAQLKDANGDLIASIPQMEITWPWSSVFSGKPELSLRLKGPEVFLSRKKVGSAGVWNFDQILKPEAPSAPASTPPAANGAVAVPALVLKSKLNLEVSDARVRVNDAMTATVMQLPSLDLKLKDVSLAHPFEWELGTRVQHALAEGAFEARGTLAPEFQNGELKNLIFSADVDATALSVRPSEGFIKAAKQPLLIAVKGSWSPAAVVLNSARLTAGKWKIDAQGRLDAAPVDRVALTVSAQELGLAQLNDWMRELPALGGQLGAEVSVTGAPSAIQVQADLKGVGMQAALPQIKGDKPQLDLTAHATLDRVDIKQARLRVGAGSKDAVTFTGSVSGLRKMPDLLRAELTVQGDHLDLDRLGLTASDPKAAAAASKSPAVPQKGGAQGSGGRAAESASVDAQWMTLSRSAMLQKAEFAFTLALGELVAQGVTLTGVKTKVIAKRGRVELSDLGFQVFEGKIRARAAVGTEGGHPALSFGGQVENLNLKKAAESQWALFKNTLEGRLELKWDAASKTLESAALLRALEMKGGFRVTGARFASVDISKILVEKINQSIDRAGEKVPALKSKRLGALPEKAAFYESVTSDFTLSQGKLQSPQFLAKPQAGAGVEISGPYDVDVVDQKWNANWVVSDPYNVTHAADLSVSVAGVDVPHILVEPGSPLKIPLQMGCTLSAPCVSNDKIVEHFARVAGANIGRGAAKAAGEQLKRLIPSDVIKKFW